MVTSLTELLLLTMYLGVSLPRNLLPMGSAWVATKIVVASAVMGVVIYLLRRYNVLVLLPVAIVVYLGTATMIRAIPSGDLSAVLAAVGKRATGARAPLVPEQPEERDASGAGESRAGEGRVSGPIEAGDGGTKVPPRLR